jgi:hypothetical protein
MKQLQLMKRLPAHNEAVEVKHGARLVASCQHLDLNNRLQKYAEHMLRDAAMRSGDLQRLQEALLQQTQQHLSTQS